MGRPTKGWVLRKPRGKRKFYTVRFTFASKRGEYSTQERDPARAARVATQIYAKALTGELDSELVNISPDRPLDELVAQWLADVHSELDEETSEEYRRYWKATLLPFFRSLSRIDRPNAQQYYRERLTSVLRPTVLKELSGLRRFLAWCEDQGILEHAPEIPSPPRNAHGTPCKKRRRSAPTKLSPAEVQAVLDALPEYSTGRDGKPFAVKARADLMYATGLRPETIDKLAYPDHYTPGSSELKISGIDDKARHDRVVPLSDAAREALDLALGPVKPGERKLIFGRHSQRYQLHKAAVHVLSPEKARTFCSYDLKHARITHWAEQSRNVAAIQYLVGHRHVSTTAKYVTPTLRAAQDLLREVGGSFGDTSGDNDSGPPTGEAGVAGNPGKCTSRDLNSNALRRRNLNPVRLPIPPLVRGRGGGA
jgi:integrase